MTPLTFLTDHKDKVSRLANLWHLDQHDIPATPGVYILVASPGLDILYPAGRSPIYYIGQTQSLWRRLAGHLKWHQEVREDCRHGYSSSEPRHEYGGEFGGRYCFIQTWQGVSPKHLEAIVLARFARRYHAFPVANHAGARKQMD